MNRTVKRYDVDKPHLENDEHWKRDRHGRYAIRRDGRTLYASCGYALDRALEEGWEMVPAGEEANHAS